MTTQLKVKWFLSVLLRRSAHATHVWQFADARSPSAMVQLSRRPTSGVLCAFISVGLLLYLLLLPLFGLTS